MQALSDGRPSYARAIAEAATAMGPRGGADPVSALGALLSPGGQLAQSCRFCYELRLHRARGYGALKAILDVLAQVVVRLVQRGVRMVQVYYSAGDPWDHHNNIQLHRKNAMDSDRPFAAVIKDLKSRGLLDDTIVVCGSEFGRTPVA